MSGEAAIEMISGFCAGSLEGIEGVVKDAQEGASRSQSLLAAIIHWKRVNARRHRAWLKGGLRW